MTFPQGDLTVRTERLGPLPLINHVLGRLGLEPLLAEFVPTADPRQQIRHARALGVLLRSPSRARMSRSARFVAGSIAESGPERS